MAKIRTLQILRGTTVQNDAYTGSAGELTMDTTTNELRLHDGSTAGGHVIGSGGGGSGYHPDLFDVKWADHILNDVQWLRADTFSWQSGSVYEVAYNHLLADLSNMSHATVYFVMFPNDSKFYFRSPQFDVSGATYPYAYTSYLDTNIITVYSSYNDSRTGVDFYTDSVGTTVFGTSVSNGHLDNLIVPTVETINGTRIAYYIASDGHKIVDASQESNVESIYQASGVAWFYIFDVVNQRFKLPRTKYGFTGLRDTVGNYVPETLPNVWYSKGGFTSDPVVDGALTQLARYNVLQNESSSSTRFIANCSFNASNCSSAYQNNAPVQQRATQMYLYFYVGQFTQTALENTAGLNAELFNDKVDKGHEVIEFQAPTAANNYTWYRKYADGWVEQGGIASINGINATQVSLLVEMADTSYYVNTQALNTGSTIWDRITAQTVSNFTVAGDYTNLQYVPVHNIYWEVKGMSA